MLVASGISIKPTEGQLNEFIKRIKTLSNDVILKLLKERFDKSLEENDTKTLTVYLLYITYYRNYFLL